MLAPYTRAYYVALVLLLSIIEGHSPQIRSTFGLVSPTIKIHPGVVLKSELIFLSHRFGEEEKISDWMV